MTAQTPIYGIKYPVAGEPIRGTRQILEDNAKAVEAALASVPLAPPGATDLAAALARIGVLEHINDAVGNLSLAANVANLTGYRAAGVYRVGRACCLTSVVQLTAAIGNAGTVATLPAGFRPAQIVPLRVTAETPTAADSSVRLDVQTDGRITAAANLVANSYLFFDSVQFPGA